MVSLQVFGGFGKEAWQGIDRNWYHLSIGTER